MKDLATQAETIAEFLKMLTTVGEFRLRYRITAGAGAADPLGVERRDIYVEMSGPDAELLTERGGEVLRSLEHVAAKILRLEPEDHDRVSFDALGFKQARAQQMKDMADEGAESVQENGRPYHYPAMTSRERRMLHLCLQGKEGVRTESDGEGPRRHVVLYPVQWRVDERATAIGKAFRRR